MLSLVFTAFWFAAIYAVYRIALKKDRNPVPWLIYGFMAPYLALPHILFVGEGTYQSVAAVKRPKSSQEDPIALANRLDAIRSGDLTPFKPSGIMMTAGEVFFYEQAAQHGQTVVDSKVVGKSSSVGIPIGGIYMNFGGSQGSVKHTERLAWGPQGAIYASNRRLVFTAGAQGLVSIPYDSILNFEAAERGLAITARDLGTHHFFTGDSGLGILLQRIVDAIHGGTEYAALPAKL